MFKYLYIAEEKLILKFCRDWLGPLVFEIYINDLPDRITSAGMSMNGVRSHLHAPLHIIIYLGVLLLLVQNFI